MRPLFYRLDDHHRPVPMEIRDPELDTLIHDIQRRRVGLDEISDYRISTVFLSLDQRCTREGPPILFETMIFPKVGYSDLYCERYATWDEAVAGHHRVVADVVAGEVAVVMNADAGAAPADSRTFLEVLDQDDRAIVEIRLAGGPTIRVWKLARAYWDVAGSVWIRARDWDRGTMTEMRIDQIQMATVVATSIEGRLPP